MPGVVICGGQKVASTPLVIGRGFERLGWDVAHVPTRDYRQPTPGHKFSLIQDAKKKIIDAAASVDARLLVWVMCKADYESGLVAVIKSKRKDLICAYHSFDDPFNIQSNAHLIAREFDLAITCCVSSIKDYEALGTPAICLYPPFDKDMHTKADAVDKYRCDFSFIATNLYPPSKYPTCRWSRADIVRMVAPLGHLKIFGPWEKTYGWGGPYGVPELKENWCGRLKYEQLPSAFKASRINLNSHVSPSGYLYLNERFTTVLGSGGFMLTDRVLGIEELLDGQPGFVVYDDLDDLKKKTRFYLDNETARLEIAQAGLALAKSRFSNKKFARQLVKFVGTIQ